MHQRIWIELNRSALIHNIMQLKQAIHPAHLALVIKCNAYGHGLLEVGRICDERPEVHMLCVAFLSEALELRAAGISKPILVMSYCDDAIEKAVGQNISIVVDSHEEMHEINRIGMQYGYRFDIHIKIDTGLARRGLKPHDIESFVYISSQLPYIRITGLCSHFASAYTSESAQTLIQIEQFTYALKQVADLHIPLIHIGASSLISPAGCTMLRIGLALYGYNPSCYNLDLKPVLTLKTHICTIRIIPEGMPIGYDGLSITTRKTRLALLPVGYADGYDMRFSLCCSVYTGNNYYAPIMGRIGMNFIAIDVTDIPHINIKDEASLIGDKPHIRVSDLIAYAGMKNIREVLARLNPAIPRYVT
ncbi:MAG TPA: alanine racemase [Candidatus Babeliales bacterium]|jgi:alanine racemase|nr:alanine racemase [Candidatus Babeliales bacterium]